jgi:tetratricopeptide (TPR) repeat protein
MRLVRLPDRRPARLNGWPALLLVLAGLLGLAGCAQVRVVPAQPAPLFHDEWFAPAAPVPTAQDVFRMSPEMLSYAALELGRMRGSREIVSDPRRELIDALYSRQRMQLQYDSSTTRNASEAFAARAGNCLSLVIMTAAFAKHLDLPVAYQAVDAPEFYSRSGGLTLASNHVNLVLAPPGPLRLSAKTISRGLEALTVDFLPRDEIRGQRTLTLSEATIVAMFLNNRAVELLASGRMDAAYAHAKAALLHDPGFMATANTLGVIYGHTDRPAAAEGAFAHVLASEPDNLSALSNQARLMTRLGRAAEADGLTQRLARLQPVTPFQQFYEGREAMIRHDYEKARDLFVRELRLQPYQDEVHFWAAQAYWQLGDRARAARHLAQAAEYSSTRSEQDRYAAKLAHLRDQTPPTP